MIENGNITREHNWKDKIHLTNYGTIHIANNFINILDKSHSPWLAHTSLPLSLAETEIPPSIIDISTPGDNVPMGKTQYDPFNLLRDIKLKNLNLLVIGQLNINSIRYKFESLQLVVKGNVDIFCFNRKQNWRIVPVAAICHGWLYHI